MQSVKSAWSILLSYLKAHVLPLVEGMIQDVKRTHPFRWFKFFYLSTVKLREREGEGDWL